MDSHKCESLSPRQKQCLRLIFAHRTAKEIARELGISEETVKTTLKEARRRLGADTSRAAALALARAEMPSPLAGDPQQRGMAERPGPVMAGPDRHREADEAGNRVGEGRPDFPPLPATGIDLVDRSDGKRGQPGSLPTMAWIALIALALALLVIASSPMVGAAQAIANLVLPPAATNDRAASPPGEETPCRTNTAAAPPPPSPGPSCR